MEHLTEHEKICLETVKELTVKAKKVLLYLIQESSHNGLVVMTHDCEEVEELVNKQLIYKNPFHKGTAHQYKILPYAPMLMKQLEEDEFIHSDLLMTRI